MRERDLTVKEAAAELGLHTETCLKLLRNGDMPGFKAGPRLWRIPRKALDEWKAKGGARPQGRPRKAEKTAASGKDATEGGASNER